MSASQNADSRYLLRIYCLFYLECKTPIFFLRLQGAYATSSTALTCAASSAIARSSSPSTTPCSSPSRWTTPSRAIDRTRRSTTACRRSSTRDRRYTAFATAKVGELSPFRVLIYRSLFLQLEKCIVCGTKRERESVEFQSHSYSIHIQVSNVEKHRRYYTLYHLYSATCYLKRYSRTDCCVLLESHAVVESTNCAVLLLKLSSRTGTSTKHFSSKESLSVVCAEVPLQSPTRSFETR